MSGWLVKGSGCIFRTFSVHRIFRNNFLNKIKSLFWLINFGEIPWSKLIENLLFGIVVVAKNYWRNFRKITKNCNKFKRKCRIILKSKELPFLDFTFCPMTNYYKFYHKLGILMQFNLTWENVLIISTQLHLLMLKNQRKLFLWLQHNLKQCLKMSNLVLLFLLRDLLKFGSWKFKRWWLKVYTISPSKLSKSILMKILALDRIGFFLIMLRMFFWLIKSSGLKVSQRQSSTSKLILKRELFTTKLSWRSW